MSRENWKKGLQLWMLWYEVVTIFSLFSSLVTHGTICMRNVISRLNKCVISKGWPWQIQVKNGLWMEVIYIWDEKSGFFSGKF